MKPPDPKAVTAILTLTIVILVAAVVVVTLLQQVGVIHSACRQTVVRVAR